MRLRTLGSGGRSRLALAAIPGMLDVDYSLVGGWSALLPLAIHGHRTRLFDNQEHILCSSPFPEITRNRGIVEFRKPFVQRQFSTSLSPTNCCKTFFNIWQKVYEYLDIFEKVFMIAYCVYCWGIHLDYLHRPRSCRGYLPTTATSGSAYCNHPLPALHIHPLSVHELHL